MVTGCPLPIRTAPWRLVFLTLSFLLGQSHEAGVKQDGKGAAQGPAEGLIKHSPFPVAQPGGQMTLPSGGHCLRGTGRCRGCSAQPTSDVWSPVTPPVPLQQAWPSPPGPHWAPQALGSALCRALAAELILILFQHHGQWQPLCRDVPGPESPGGWRSLSRALATLQCRGGLERGLVTRCL